MLKQVFEKSPTWEKFTAENESGFIESVHECFTCGALVHQDSIPAHLFWHSKRDEQLVRR